MKLEFGILDRIKIESCEFIGVVDYISNKYVTFFDVTGNNDPNITRLLIIYKMYYSHMRFSIFKAMYFPQFEMDAPKMINRKSVIESTHPLEVEQKPIKKKAVLKSDA